ncbi:MAG: hypothetical protein JNL41_09555 [Phenylobacterium sp.]|uniref:hypothetical protein n=1 Tax=Phenylobacterium sp. TaxID=1871053 RepID=UPI001A387D34|nr:hypothetical protein [Phenylobacterium sp.]MBL8554511.1 hypothetical protein [Phenylobacterium sp.]
MEAYSLLMIAGAIVLVVVWGLISQRASDRRLAAEAQAKAEAEAALAPPTPMSYRPVPRRIEVGR